MFTIYNIFTSPLGSGMPLPLLTTLAVQLMSECGAWSVTCVTELSELEKISWLSCGLQIGTSLASMTGVVRSQGNEWPCNCWQPSEIQILRLGHGVEKHTWIKRSCQHTQCKLQRFSCAKFDVLIFQVSSVPLSTWIGKYQMNESATSLPQPLKN